VTWASLIAVFTLWYLFAPRVFGDDRLISLLGYTKEAKIPSQGIPSKARWIARSAGFCRMYHGAWLRREMLATCYRDKRRA